MKVGDLVKMTDWLVMPARRDTIGVVLKVKPAKEWEEDKAYVWFDHDWQEWVIFRNLEAV